MAWARLDDNFPDHPKVAGLSDGAFRLHVRAICYASKFQTKGEILPAAIKALQARRKHVEELVEAACWDTTSRDSWAIHDFDEYNPSREQLAQRRAEAGRVGGQKSGEARRSKHEANAKQLLPENEAKHEANAKQNTKQNEAHAGTRARSRPLPSPSSEGEIAPSLSPRERDMAEALLSKCPQSVQRDPTARDEAEDFARDYAGQEIAMAKAVRECRQNGEFVSPQNVRKRMPPLPGLLAGLQQRPQDRPMMAEEVDALLTARAMSRPLIPGVSDA